MDAFADRLCDAVRNKKTPVMAGIDPQWDLLPDEVKAAAEAVSGEPLQIRIAAYRRFCTEILDVVCGNVPIVKFQMAFFEALGPAGMSLLFELAADAHDRGVLVVFDGKRNDIGSSAAGYAEAYLGEAAPVDALTVNPYLGPEGLEPFVKIAQRNDRGVFVLVRTSNPGAGQLQDVVVDNVAIHERVADWVEGWSQAARGNSGYGPTGAVVGATVPEQLARLRRRMPTSILLVPGYGAQGGSAADVAGAFDVNGLGAVVNSSRGILFAYREPRFHGVHWKDAATNSLHETIGELAAKTPAGRLRQA